MPRTETLRPGRPSASLARRRLVRHWQRLSQDFTPPFQDFTPPETAGESGGLTAPVTTGNRQVACLQVDGHLTEELLYRYRRYRLHNTSAGIDRPDCNRPAELDPQRSRAPEDSVDDSRLASCK